MRVFVRSSMTMSPRVDFPVFQEVEDVGGLGVGQLVGLGHERAGRFAGVADLLEGPLLLGQDADRHDPEDVALEGLAHFIDLEDHVEELVPRHVHPQSRHGAPDVGIEDDVELVLFPQPEDDVAQVGVLELRAEEIAGVSLRGVRDRPGLVLLGLGGLRLPGRDRLFGLDFRLNRWLDRLLRRLLGRGLDGRRRGLGYGRDLRRNDGRGEGDRPVPRAGVDPERSGLAELEDETGDGVWRRLLELAHPEDVHAALADRAGQGGPVEGRVVEIHDEPEGPFQGEDVHDGLPSETGRDVHGLALPGNDDVGKRGRRPARGVQLLLDLRRDDVPARPQDADELDNRPALVHGQGEGKGLGERQEERGPSGRVGLDPDVAQEPGFSGGQGGCGGRRPGPQPDDEHGRQVEAVGGRDPGPRSAGVDDDLDGRPAGRDRDLSRRDGGLAGGAQAGRSKQETQDGEDKAAALPVHVRAPLK